MRANWDAPACQWRSDLPADCTLREYAKGLRAWGRTWKQVGERIGIPWKRVWMSAQYVRGQKRKPKVERWQKRVAAAYGMTWEQLQMVRAAGLTVKQFRERVEERKQSA